MHSFMFDSEYSFGNLVDPHLFEGGARFSEGELRAVGGQVANPTGLHRGGILHGGIELQIFGEMQGWYARAAQRNGGLRAFDPTADEDEERRIVFFGQHRE